MSTTKTRTTRLTVADIEAGYAEPEWQGFGYLGARTHEADDSEAGFTLEDRAIADKVLLATANALGLSRADFFLWLNSRLGRHYGDMALHCGSSETEIRTLITKHSYLTPAVMTTLRAEVA